MEHSLNNNGLLVSKTEMKGFSDNKNFDILNIPNVCLIEENVKEIIHTPKDVPEKINYSRINLTAKSIVDFINDSGYRLLNIE